MKRHKLQMKIDQRNYYNWLILFRFSIVPNRMSNDDLLKLNTANSVRTHETSGNINNYVVAPKIMQHIKSRWHPGDEKSIPVESRQTRFWGQSRYRLIPVPAKMVQSRHYPGTGQNSYPGRILLKTYEKRFPVQPFLSDDLTVVRLIQDRADLLVR